MWKVYRQTDGQTDDGQQVIRKVHFSVQLRWVKTPVVFFEYLEFNNWISELRYCKSTQTEIFISCSFSFDLWKELNVYYFLFSIYPMGLFSIFKENFKLT